MQTFQGANGLATTELAAARPYPPGLSAAPKALAPVKLGAFMVLPAARTLLHDGKPIELGDRAFDILLTLLSAQSQIVSKEAIMREVWQDVTVEAANVRVQLGRLRHALGEERWRIKTVQGRGYLLILDLSAAGPVDTNPALASLAEPAIIIIDADQESREELRRLLTGAGVRVESLTSLCSRLAG